MMPDVDTNTRINPFALISDDERRRYAGLVVAVDLDNGGAVAGAESPDELDALMTSEHPEVRYGRFCLPKL
jgi:hypothetical protein